MVTHYIKKHMETSLQHSGVASCTERFQVLVNADKWWRIDYIMHYDPL